MAQLKPQGRAEGDDLVPRWRKGLDTNQQVSSWSKNRETDVSRYRVTPSPHRSVKESSPRLTWMCTRKKGGQAFAGPPPARMMSHHARQLLNTHDRSGSWRRLPAPKRRSALTLATILKRRCRCIADSLRRRNPRRDENFTCLSWRQYPWSYFL